MSKTDISAQPARSKHRLTASATLATRSLIVTVSQDRSVRRTVIGLFLLLPVVVSLPVQRLEHLLLVLSMMLVVFAEILNSAIELIVDRISLETHPLSKAAKDTAAAAVVAAVLMSGLCWTVIAGPVAWALLTK
jgi:diacylglycerol kinase